jgi:hypothetical protein
MLAALSKSKLDRELKRPVSEIEDLLTAVVFGSCKYVPPWEALLPFLGRALDERRAPLGAQLEDVVDVEYDFWPSWKAAVSSVPPADESTEVSGGISLACHDGGIPELVLKLRRQNRPSAWMLVEAKLYSGKSSRPTPGSGRVTDQLGKYWLELRGRAESAGAEPLGVVYVTRGSLMPLRDLRETQQDLAEAGEAEAPLFWLSWGHFIEACRRPLAHPLVKDVVDLLCDLWHLEHVKFGTWPVAHEAPPRWIFASRWCWPAPGNRTSWAFDDERRQGT